ncbi:Uncharacterised protein [Mycobacterium tuberculosis]|nr:Uncharacterised protein [Mycobacterium tuberculosis]
MARQSAVTESAHVGFVDDIHHSARRTQESDSHQHHRGHDGGFGAGPHPQAGVALHAPMHDGVGGLLKTLAAGADLRRHVKVVVARGQSSGRCRAHLRIGQRQIGQRIEVHLASLPRQRIAKRACTQSMRRPLRAVVVASGDSLGCRAICAAWRKSSRPRGFRLLTHDEGRTPGAVRTTFHQCWCGLCLRPGVERQGSSE